MLILYVFTVGMFTVGIFIVGMFTVGLVLFVLKAPTHPPTHPPLLHRGNDVCPLFGVIV